MSLPRPYVIVGTPCYGGLLTHVYVHSLLKLREYAGTNGIGLSLWTAAHDSLIPRSRNSILAAFLDTPGATHLLFVDADMGYEPEQLGRMLALDVDFVAGVYPIKNIDWSEVERGATYDSSAANLRQAGLHFVGIPCPPEIREERLGFVTGLYAGAGFMLLRRAVVEQLVAAHPETKYRSAQTYPAPKLPSQNQYNLFDCILTEEGVYLSEDFTFCHRWRALGGKIWLDTQSVMKHVGSHEFFGSPARRFGP